MPERFSGGSDRFSNWDDLFEKDPALQRARERAQSSANKDEKTSPEPELEPEEQTPREDAEGTAKVSEEAPEEVPLVNPLVNPTVIRLKPSEPVHPVREDSRSSGPGRRRFLGILGSALGLVVLGEGASIIEKFVEKKEREKAQGIVDLKGIHEDSPNEEFIRTNALRIMKLVPGGYAASLTARDTATIFGEGRKSHSRNFRGRDERTLEELSFLHDLLKEEDRFIAVRDSIEERLKVAPDQNRETSGAKKSEVTPGDLILVLQILGSTTARRLALKALYQFMENGSMEKYGIKPISEAKKIWAKQHHIEEWNMAWAEAMQPLAERMLISDPETWFDALDPKEREKRVAHIKEYGISNPGVVAMLEDQETNDMTFIGDAPFATQINPAENQYPTAEHDMERIAHYLQKEWKLPYAEDEAYQYTPGSLRKGSASGGAVFGQLMPINLDLFISKYEHTRSILKDEGIDLPPLLPGSPWGMSLLKYLYLNAEWRAVQGHAPDRHVTAQRGHKGGYIVGDDEASRAAAHWAFVTWNPYKPEVRAVTLADASYTKEFGNKKGKAVSSDSTR